MKITIRESGGFAPGLRKPPRTVESSQLEEDKAAELTKLVADAVSTVDETESPSTNTAPDAVSYTIIVEDDGKATQLRQSDVNLSQPVADLMAWVDENRTESE